VEGDHRLAGVPAGLAHHGPVRSEASHGADLFLGHRFPVEIRERDLRSDGTVGNGAAPKDFRTKESRCRDRLSLWRHAPGGIEGRIMGFQAVTGTKLSGIFSQMLLMERERKRGSALTRAGVHGG
jgi:hypothetical protein